MKSSKNIVLILALSLFSIAICHAQDAIDKYYSKYADDVNFTSIVVTEKMFQLFSSVDASNPDIQDISEVTKGLKGIRILASGNSEGGDSPNINYKDAISLIGREYELLMSVDEKDEKIRFFILENGDKIAELFMILGGDGNLFMMSLVGDIDLNKVSKLSKNLNIGGVNYLENLDEETESK